MEANHSTIAASGLRFIVSIGMRLFQTLAAGALAAAACASFAVAEGLHVPVGDLTQHGGAVAFDHRLADAADKFCFARYRPMELGAIAACQKAVRAEALDQLTPAQRETFAQQLRASPRLASGEH